MAESSFRLPPMLDLLDDNLAETYRKWKRQMEIYMLASGASTKSKKTKVAIILHCAGPQVLEIYDQFCFERDEDKDDPDKVLDKLEEYCCPRTSEVLQSFRFWKITFKEPFNSFLIELKSQAEYCNFKEKDRMIRDKIVFSTSGKLQELLLRERNLDLDKTVEICLVFEATTRFAKEMCKTESNQEVNKIHFSNNKDKRENYKEYAKQQSPDRFLRTCKY